MRLVVTVMNVVGEKLNSLIQLCAAAFLGITFGGMIGLMAITITWRGVMVLGGIILFLVLFLLSLLWILENAD